MSMTIKKYRMLHIVSFIRLMKKAVLSNKRSQSSSLNHRKMAQKAAVIAYLSRVMMRSSVMSHTSKRALKDKYAMSFQFQKLAK